MRPLPIFHNSEGLLMENEQQSHTKIEGKEVEYKIQDAEPEQGSGPTISLTVVPTDVSPEMIIAAVKEAAYDILVPLNSKGSDLEMMVLRHEIDPYVAFFQLKDPLTEAFKAWVRDPMRGA